MRLRRKFGIRISEFGENVTSARRQPKRYIRHKVTSARAEKKVGGRRSEFRGKCYFSEATAEALYRGAGYLSKGEAQCAFGVNSDFGIRKKV